MNHSDRRGFSLIELVMVVSIVSLLAAIAQPALNRVVVKARAAEAISNLNVIKVAVQGYEADFLNFPPEAAVGVIPTGLVDYLPDNFVFAFDGYTLDYDNFTGPDGQPVDDGTFSVGLTVVPDDLTLGQAMVQLIGSGILAFDDRFTWIIID